MFLSKKVINLLLAFNVFFGLLLRYKSALGIENGNPDSWDYHLQINQIITEGKISWIFHPLSYYGMYPPNMEMGIETFISSLSAVSGISVTHSILLVSIIIGISSGPSAFILSRELFNDNYLAIFFAILFSCSTLIYQSTGWGVNRRLFASILIISSNVLLLLSYKNRAFIFRFIFLFSISLIAFLSVHKSVLFELVYLLLFITVLILKRYTLNFTLFMNSNVSRIYRPLVFIIILGIILLGSILNNDYQNMITFLDSIYIDAFDMSMELGVLALFGVVGIYGFTEKRISFGTSYFLLLLIVGLFVHLIIPQPRGLIREPVSFYIFFPLYFVLIVIGLTNFAQQIGLRKNMFPFILVVITSACLLPEFVVVNSSSYAEDSENRLFNQYNSGIYVKEELSLESDEQILGYGVQTDRVMSFAGGKHYYPGEIKSINFTFYSFDASTFFESRKAEGFVKGEGLRYTTLLSENYMKNQISSPRVILDLKYYQISYIFLNHNYLEERGSILMESVVNERYSTYNSNGAVLYYTKI